MSHLLVTESVNQDSQHRLAQPDLSITAIREFLSFTLGKEEYAMDIMCVQEIRSYEQPTRMANTPNFIIGMVNLRGVIVPIIDMRIKYNLQQVDYNRFTVVIILNIGTHVVGIVVDGVSDVITFSLEQLHPAPDIESTIGSNHVLAIGSVADRMLILLDIKKLLSSAEMGLIEETTL